MVFSFFKKYMFFPTKSCKDFDLCGNIYLNMNRSHCSDIIFFPCSNLNNWLTCYIGIDLKEREEGRPQLLGHRPPYILGKTMMKKFIRDRVYCLWSNNLLIK